MKEQPATLMTDVWSGVLSRMGGGDLPRMRGPCRGKDPLGSPYEADTPLGPLASA